MFDPYYVSMQSSAAIDLLYNISFQSFLCILFAFLTPSPGENQAKSSTSKLNRFIIYLVYWKKVTSYLWEKGTVWLSKT